MSRIDGDCPVCGHPWDLHPVVIPTLSACAECIYLEGTGRGDVLCGRVPVRAYQVAGALVHGAVAGGPLRAPRLVLRWSDGSRWAAFKLPYRRTARDREEDALRRDLDRLSLAQFLEHHRSSLAW
jgi:hypothetical protein